MNGNMDVIVSRIPNAISIPAKAVFTRNGKPIVYVAEKGALSRGGCRAAGAQSGRGGGERDSGRHDGHSGGSEARVSAGSKDEKK